MVAWRGGGVRVRAGRQQTTTRIGGLRGMFCGMDHSKSLVLFPNTVIEPQCIKQSRVQKISVTKIM